MNVNRIDHAVHALTSAQNHFEEYVLDRIVEAKTPYDALDVVHIMGYVAKIKKDISGILGNIGKMPL